MRNYFKNFLILFRTFFDKFFFFLIFSRKRLLRRNQPYQWLIHPPARDWPSIWPRIWRSLLNHQSSQNADVPVTKILEVCNRTNHLILQHHPQLLPQQQQQSDVDVHQSHWVQFQAHPSTAISARRTSNTSRCEARTTRLPDVRECIERTRRTPCSMKQNVSSRSTRDCLPRMNNWNASAGNGGKRSWN